MTEFKMDPIQDCVEEYIRLSLSKNSAQKALKAALYVCTALIALMGITLAVIMSQPFPLLITLAAALAGAAYPLLMKLFLKSAAEKSFSSMTNETGVVAAVSEMNIIMIKDGIPAGVVEWSDISEMTEGKTGFFLMAKEQTLLMLAKDSVVSGTYDEAVQVLRGKAAAKPVTAKPEAAS